MMKTFEDQEIPSNYFTAVDIIKAIEELNMNKSVDEFGLCAEHLKFCKNEIAPYLTKLFNNIIETLKTPGTFKTGILFHVLKKDKDPSDVNSYRGITVTPVPGKAFEYCILPKLNLQNITDLQFGFTKGLNPLISSFNISESKYDQTRKNSEFYMGFLDVKSAFDVGQHDIILDKLLESNIPSFLWLVIKDLYSNLTTKKLEKGRKNKCGKKNKACKTNSVCTNGLWVHGTNGLDPVTSYKIYNTYVLPRLLYGLEAIPLNKTNITQLESFHRKILRHLQSLPQRTAIAAIYLLIGGLLIEAELHKKQLSFLHNLLSSNVQRVKDIIIRQMSVNYDNPNSLFSTIREILLKYGLPPIHLLQESLPSKMKWKSIVTKQLNTYWLNTLRDDAESKSTLRYMETKHLLIGKNHPVWNIFDKTKAEVRKPIIKLE
ncbi:unnamed protein product [Mytilus coruscus]|uniref:Reverse transcriptase domain-containing protein n=1 Tax=Mytilus coruscus TaxID=42192 RepID=A0A6J8CJY1_MYTCO|nr:unnamed protein product [Mytilus coruscus]